MSGMDTRSMSRLMGLTNLNDPGTHQNVHPTSTHATYEAVPPRNFDPLPGPHLLVPPTLPQYADDTVLLPSVHMLALAFRLLVLAHAQERFRKT